MVQSSQVHDLNDLVVFARVVHAGSFTAAARSLGRPKSTVSRKVAELEQRLGARLLQRTTRRLRLTDEGRAFYAHCERIIAEIAEAERALDGMHDQPRGLLRVTTPLNFGFLGAIVAEYLRAHPDVEVELVCTDRVVDLIEEGFDVAIRGGTLADSTLVARHLGSIRRFLVAAPEYLAQHGSPASPSDLAKHACVAFRGGSERTAWTLQSASESVEVTVRTRLAVNDFDVLHDVVRSGLGIGLLAADRAVPDIRAGRLRRILDTWCTPPMPIQAVYPSSRHLTARLRAFLGLLQARMTPPPWELGPAA